MGYPFSTSTDLAFTDPDAEGWEFELLDADGAPVTEPFLDAAAGSERDEPPFDYAFLDDAPSFDTGDVVRKAFADGEQPRYFDLPDGNVDGWSLFGEGTDAVDAPRPAEPDEIATLPASESEDEERFSIDGTVAAAHAADAWNGAVDVSSLRFSDLDDAIFTVTDRANWTGFAENRETVAWIFQDPNGLHGSTPPSIEGKVSGQVGSGFEIADAQGTPRAMIHTHNTFMDRDGKPVHRPGDAAFSPNQFSPEDYGVMRYYANMFSRDADRPKELRFGLGTPTGQVKVANVEIPDLSASIDGVDRYYLFNDPNGLPEDSPYREPPYRFDITEGELPVPPAHLRRIGANSAWAAGAFGLGKGLLDGLGGDGRLDGNEIAGAVGDGVGGALIGGGSAIGEHVVARELDRSVGLAFQGKVADWTSGLDEPLRQRIMMTSDPSHRVATWARHGASELGSAGLFGAATAGGFSLPENGEAMLDSDAAGFGDAWGRFAADTGGGALSAIAGTALGSAAAGSIGGPWGIVGGFGVGLASGAATELFYDRTGIKGAVADGTGGAVDRAMENGAVAETVKEVDDGLETTVEFGKTVVDGVRDGAGDVLENGKAFVSGTVEAVGETVESGKRFVEEAVNDVEEAVSNIGDDVSSWFQERFGWSR